jgi:hemin uptake protein HemP
MAENQSRPEQERKNEERPDQARIIDSADLFQDRREVYIEHEGVRYRLRITRRNKLILQK